MRTTNGSTITDTERITLQICTLLSEIDICLIWIRGKESDLQRRPMIYQINNLDGGLWFFSEATPRLFSLYSSNPEVTVAVSCPTLKKCGALVGGASIVNHKPSLAHFNVQENEAMLSPGYSKKRLVLLKIAIKQMDFWEWPNGTLIHSSLSVPNDMTIGGRVTADGHPFYQN